MTERHTLTLDRVEHPKPLPYGVAQERHWYCTCGNRYFGYDNAVKRAHTAHRAATKAPQYATYGIAPADQGGYNVTRNGEVFATVNDAHAARRTANLDAFAKLAPLPFPVNPEV